MRIMPCLISLYLSTNCNTNTGKQTNRREKCFSHIIGLLHNGNIFSSEFPNLKSSKSVLIFCKINFKLSIKED